MLSLSVSPIVRAFFPPLSPPASPPAFTRSQPTITPVTQTDAVHAEHNPVHTTARTLPCRGHPVIRVPRSPTLVITGCDGHIAVKKSRRDIAICLAIGKLENPLAACPQPISPASSEFHLSPSGGTCSSPLSLTGNMQLCIHFHIVRKW